MLKRHANRWLVLLLALVGNGASQQVGTALVEAVKNRDTSAVRALLKEYADVNTAAPDGATALHWAAHWDDVGMAELLIRAGATVNVANDYGVTPLVLACENGSAPMVEKLLTAGANPNAALPTGETPLMIAARTGKVEAVRVLLSRGADSTAKETSQGQDALMWAVAQGHLDVVRMLLEHGANVHARSDAGFAPLLFAARAADLNATRILLAAGANVNDAASDGTTALLVATIRGHTAYAEFLLEQGADPNLGAGYTPLHWAAGDWDTDLTGRLAEGTEWSALGGLRGQTKLDFVNMLLAHGADPNARLTRNPRRYGGGGGMAGNLAGGTPFLLAATAGDVGVMRVLLAAGGDPRLAATTNTTPLMMAAGLGYVPGATRVPESSALEAVTLCLALGADVNAVNAAGDTPLHGAAYRGADTIVQLLVDRGAKVNVKNKRQWTPLTIAEGINQSGGLQRFPSTEALLRKVGAEPSPPDIQR